MPPRKDFADLIGSWPVEGKRTSIRTFSDDTGIAYVHACMMKQRNFIAPEYWPQVVAAARKRSLAYTMDLLVEMTQQVKQRRRKKRSGKRKPEAQAAA